MPQLQPAPLGAGNEPVVVVEDADEGPDEETLEPEADNDVPALPASPADARDFMNGNG